MKKIGIANGPFILTNEYRKHAEDLQDIIDIVDSTNIYQPQPKLVRGQFVEAVRTEPKIGRNEPCPCGSGKKYKKCCI